MLNNMSYQEIKIKTKALEQYEILINDDDEVLIVLPVKVPGSANEKSAVYYSGGKHAFLIKNNRTVVLCDYLNPQTHQTIYKNETLLIAEYPPQESSLGESKSEKGSKDNPSIEEYEVPIIKIEGMDELAERIMADKEKEGK